MKKLILFFFLIGTINILSQSKFDNALEAIDDENYNKAFEIAEQALSEDSAKTALKILLNLNDELPNDRRVFELIGDSYSKMNVAENALTYYRKAEAMDSLNIPLKFKVAHLLYKEKRYTDAANKYLKIIDIEPNNKTALYELGTLLYNAKEYANAAYYLTKYLGFEEKYDAYLNASQAYYIIKDYKDADSLVEKALLSFPNDLKLLKISADSKLALNKVDDALKIYDSLPDTLIKSADLNRIARYFDSNRKDSLAALYINRSFYKDSTQTDLFLFAGNTNLMAKNYDKAAYYYKKHLETDPTSVSTITNLGLTFVQLKDYEKAKKEFVRAIDQQNDFIPAYIWYARVERMTDSLDKALEIYHELINAASGNEDKYKNEVSESYAFLGYGDLLHKRYSSAIDNLKSAVNYLPSSAQYHVWLAQAYALSGNKSRASVEYNNALEIDPGNPDALKGLKFLKQQQ